MAAVYMDIVTSYVTLLVAVLTLLSPTSGTYLSYNYKESKVHEKSNTITEPKQYGSSFRSDKDVSKYLKLYGRDMMLWRCRNAIQAHWDLKPIPVLNLYCEVIGWIRNVTWSHNGKTVSTSFDTHYGQMIKPHFSGSKWISNWLEFHLKIFRATPRDSGLYTFKVLGPSGEAQQQYIYVDISEKKRRKRKNRKEDRALRRKLRKERREKLKLEYWKTHYKVRKARG